jgi:Raf kinase inhibitor-like YbhB/YbcL family protein
MILPRPLAPDPYSLLPAVPAFHLASHDVVDGQPMDVRHSVDGENVSPQLDWSGFPPETRSFSVTCFDPDAPTPSGYWHWVTFNLPPTTTSLPRGAGTPFSGALGAALPPGTVTARSDGATLGYEGAAPPAGDRPHRYIFAVHALDVPELGPTAEATPAQVAFMSVFHTLARAVIAPTYQR